MTGSHVDCELDLTLEKRLDELLQNRLFELKYLPNKFSSRYLLYNEVSVS